MCRSCPGCGKGLKKNDSYILDYAKGGEMDSDGVWTWKNAPREEVRFRMYWKYYPTFIHFLDDKKVYTPDTEDFGVYGHQCGTVLATPEQSEFTVTMVASDPPPPREWEQDRHIYLPEKLDLTLVDPDNKPVAGATVKVMVGLIDLGSLTTMWNDNGKRYEGTVQTDADGKCVVPFTSFKRNQAILFDMKIDAGEDYVPARALWRESFGLDRQQMPVENPTNHVPRQWTMTMQRCDTTASGTVVDEEGNGLPGVRVTLYATQQIRYYGTLTPGGGGMPVITTTDSEGKWCVPKLYFQGKTPSYAEYSCPGYVSRRSNDDPQPHVMKKATSVTVHVKDAFGGTPVSDAWVYLNGTGVASDYGPRAKNGYYDAYLDPAGLKSVEAVVLPRYNTPARVVHEIRSDTELVEVTLKPGKPLRIRVIYPDGSPVSGVGVHLTLTWPENKNLRLRNELYFTLDSDGTYIWGNAPDIEADYHFRMSKRTQEKTYRMRPREEEYTITVLRGN